MNIGRKKIIIIVLAIMVYILLCSFFFGAFFNNYVESQENAQMNSIYKSLNTYVNNKANKYQIIASDWAHRDETYNFMMGNETYIDSNLTEQTFINLDVSFMIYNYNYDWIYYSKYYDFKTKEFGNFDSAFTEESSKIFSIADSMEGFSSVFKIGDKFYFIASSGITDSPSSEITNGKLILGRLLDFSDFEKEMDCELIEIKTTPNLSSGNEVTAVNSVSKDDNNMLFRCIIPSELGNSSLALTFEKKRDLYQSGTSEFIGFAIKGSLCLVVFMLLIFALYSAFQSKSLNKFLKRTKIANHKATGNRKTSSNNECTSKQLVANVPLDPITHKQNTDMLFDERIYTAMRSIFDGLIVTSKDGTIRLINSSAQKLTGLDKDAIGMPFDDLFKFTDKGKKQIRKSPIKEALKTKTVTGPAENTTLIIKDKKKIDIEYTVSPILDKGGYAISSVMIFRDFSKKQVTQKQIEYIGYHDQLTGLYNRRYIEEELKRLNTKRNLPISLVFADVNGLKILNDAFGHQSGDQLLCKVADVIRETCRADELIARVGGDEFIILLHKVDKNSAELLINRIKKKVEKHKIMGIGISISFGCATKTSESQSIQDILKSAEDLMYHNKILSNPNIRKSLIKSVLTKLHEKSQIEKDHSRRVSKLCEELGKADNMGEDEIKELKAAGLLHDIGKVAIDMEVLNSTKKLTKADWDQIKNHPEKGYRILITSTGFYTIAEFVLMHHERWDGKGYPKGLAGKRIPKQARIVAIADAYDSMTTTQPYSKALTIDQAVTELKKSAGTQFDPELIKVFIEKVLRKQ